MGLIKKVYVKFGDFIFLFYKKYKRWKIKSNNAINIDNHARIHYSSRIETKFGGTIDIGNSEVLENVIIQTYGGKIIIGDRCSINANTIIYGHGNTTIGNDVLIAGGCMIIPSNHNFSDSKSTIQSQGEEKKPIVIEDNVWIAHGCSILSGVKIGTGSIIAAGAVVNGDIEPFSVYAGVPAKKIKSRKI